MSDLPALPEIEPGTYQHYKGGIYELVSVGRHSETLEPMCIYVSAETGEFWVRPAEMWNEAIPVPRFQKTE